MKVGDLVKNIFTGELGLITGFAIDNPGGYAEVICLHDHCSVPIDHLELVHESR